MEKSKEITRIARISVMIIFAMLSARVYGQQEAEYTQYMFNTLSVNPAYASTKNALNAILLSRDQWVGLAGAPKTQSLTVIVPVMKERIAVGFSFVRDQVGPLTTDNLSLDFAYKIKIHQDGYLTMGVDAGIDYKKSDLTSLTPLDKSDPSYNSNYMSKLAPSFGAGLYYYYASKLYLGVSTPTINQSDLSVDASGSVGGVNDQSLRHYYIIGGYVIDLSEKIKFKPAFFTKLVKGAPASVDLTAQFMFSDRLILGAAYRVGDSFSVMAELRVFEKFWIGYAFDQTLTKLATYNSGTHEILLSMDLEMVRDGIIKSPRFF